MFGVATNGSYCLLSKRYPIPTGNGTLSIGKVIGRAESPIPPSLNTLPGPSLPKTFTCMTFAWRPVTLSSDHVVHYGHAIARQPVIESTHIHDARWGGQTGLVYPAVTLIGNKLQNTPKKDLIATAILSVFLTSMVNCGLWIYFTVFYIVG